MTEHHPSFPNAIEALLLIALLMAIELFVAAAVFDADLLAGVNDGDVYGFITVVGNGILFIGLLTYKRIGYRALFHPAGHSLTATMTLVTVPILMLVPGLVFLAGALNSIVVWMFLGGPLLQRFFDVRVVDVVARRRDFFALVSSFLGS